MKINVIAATVVCRIGFSTPGGALHAEFGESLSIFTASISPPKNPH